MKRILLLIIISTLMFVSAVSATNNNTDVVNDIPQIINKDVNDNVKLIKDVNKVTKEKNNVKLKDKDTTNNKTISKIESQNKKGYASFKTNVPFRLTTNNKPLSSKKVSILINGLNYTRITDNNGQASVNVSLKKGIYTAKFNYFGDNLTTNASSTSKIKIVDPINTSLNIGDANINYRQGSNCLFYVKLVDSNGKAIKNKNITFKLDNKTYYIITDKKGNAKLYLNLKKGKHKIKYSFKKEAPYLSSKGSSIIKVKPKLTKGNGYWLWSAHMKSVNLKSLAKKGTKHIFLHSHSIYKYGKSRVISFIKKAHKYGIKVHLWMQVCYKGGKWTSPINHDDGSIKYGFLNEKIREAKRYAKITGVDGVHFDYVRFGGTAHKYENSTKAINYFVKKASIQVHKIKPNCIVSAAIMPEPKMMLYYYGQDIPKMSRYVDTLLPMAYKGNYNKKTPWIESVTKTFVNQSNGAQIWTGLQAYLSDSNTKKLSQSDLLKDAKAAISGGAKGVILFRIGVSCNFNFKNV